MTKTSYIDFEKVDDYGPQSAAATFAVEPADLERDEIVAGGEVTIDLVASEGHLEREYLVEGTVRYTADLTCSRCLDPVPFANTSDFTVRFRPRPNETANLAEEMEISAEELDVEFYTDMKVDLRTLAIEQIQLSVPMKPLGDAACMGLCSKCGANLNAAGCKCSETVMDDRWGGLRDIREQLLKKKDS